MPDPGRRGAKAAHHCTYCTGHVLTDDASQENTPCRCSQRQGTLSTRTYRSRRPCHWSTSTGETTGARWCCRPRFRICSSRAKRYRCTMYEVETHECTNTNAHAETAAGRSKRNILGIFCFLFATRRTSLALVDTPQPRMSLAPRGACALYMASSDVADPGKRIEMKWCVTKYRTAACWSKPVKQRLVRM